MPRLSSFTGFIAAAARSRLYWRARRGLLLGVFRARRASHRARTAIARASDEASIIWAFARTSLTTLILAVGTAVALQFGIAPWIDVPGVRTPVDPDGYSSLLQTVASVTGVFLALHFGASTAVAGTTYANVPTCVRDFYVAEKFGNTYVKFLLLVTAFAVALMGLDAFGFEAQPEAVAILTIVSIPAMVAFTHLVRYHFRLLDPTVLAEQAGQELFRTIRNATYKGYAWSDASFQQHNHDLASGHMRVLAALCEVAAEPEGSDAASCARLGRILVACLQSYGDEKHAIPPDSRWFERKLRPANWYMTSATTLDMADRMGTGIQASEVPDPHWFERRVLGALRQVMIAKLHRDRREATQVLMGLATRTRFSAGVFDVRALDVPLFDFLGEVVDIVVEKPSARAVDDLALIESVCLVAIESLIGFALSASDLLSFDYDGCARAARSRRPRAVFAVQRPAAVQQRLVRLQRQLMFEQAAEGAQVTPDWFVRHQLQIVLGHEFAECLQLLLARATWFQSRAAECVARKAYAQATILTSRGVEYVTRVGNHLDRLKRAFDSLMPAFNATDWHPASVDWSKHETDLQQAAAQLERGFAQLIVYLGSVTEPSEDLPDLLGESVHRTGVALLRHLEAGVSAPLPPLVAAYFHGSLIVFNRHRELPRGNDVEGHVLLSLEPLYDLMCLSGLAYAWSELHGRPELWDPWQEAWEVFFSDTSRDRFAFIAAALSMKRGSFRMLERDVTRTGWIRGLEHAVSSLPTASRRSRHWLADDVQVRHGSKFIRAIGRHRPVNLTGGLDIFVDCFLRKLPGFSPHDLGRPRLDLRDDDAEEPGSER